MLTYLVPTLEPCLLAEERHDEYRWTILVIYEIVLFS